MNTTALLERDRTVELPHRLTSPDGPLTPPPLINATKLGGSRYHVGRHWLGPGEFEASCPCHKAECGLVDDVDEFCSEHGPIFAKTMRTTHHERDCKGENHFKGGLL